MKQISPVRPSPIAGSWYDSYPERLAAEIDVVGRVEDEARAIK